MRIRFYASNFVDLVGYLEFFAPVQDREKSTRVTWTKILGSKSEGLSLSWNEESRWAFLKWPGNPIFLSEKLYESVGFRNHYIM